MQQTKPEVLVLLATYNGETYLETQLTSLISQNGVRVRIIANDDGSTDSTLTILEKWHLAGHIESISVTPRVGSTKVFLNLLRHAGTAKLVAFSDQDDIWDLDKLIKLQMLVKGNSPLLAYSSRRIIDGQGELINLPSKIKLIPSFSNALVENVVPGNCMLINKKAIELINSFENPDVLHYDSWIYLVISYFGKCEFWPSPLISYRIHSRNSIGLRKIGIRKQISSVNSYIRQAKYLESQLDGIGSGPNFVELQNLLKASYCPNLFLRTIRILKLKINRKSYIDSLLFKLILINGT
jgi:glycosyltransferase involved in cell wall biosynthesis